MKAYIHSWILQFAKRQTILIINLLLVCLSISLTVSAKEKNNVSNTDTLNYSWERFSINFGGFLTGLNSDIQLRSQEVGLGLIVNVEDALGLQTSSTVLRSEMQYNFGKRGRHKAAFEYFGLFRGANKVLESDVELGDQVYPIGSQVNSRYNLQIFKSTYSYSFYQDKRVKLDASIGMFVMPTRFSVNAKNLEGSATDFVAPLPVIGLGTNFAITSKLYLKQNIDFLYLKISNFKGLITDFNFRFVYNAWDHFGLGIGLNTFSLEIDAYDDKHTFFDFKGNLKTGYSGLLFYVKYYL